MVPVIRQGWPNYGRPISLIQPAKYLAYFFQAPRFRLWTALAAACHISDTVPGSPVPGSREFGPRVNKFGHPWLHVKYKNTFGYIYNL